ncbi:MAG: hypothetical protein OXR66_00380 [Candidatus Woesearchaeota archaeon]|nr:hypothetical protein [Candidatus Woesearchaeota archaeon]
MGSRAQAAMEYLLIVGLSAMLVLPLIVVSMSQSQRFADDITASQVENIAGAIIDSANTVYYSGEPAKKTIVLNFPERIQSVTVNNDSILFTVMSSSGTYEYVRYTNGPLNGTIRTFAGLHRITLEAWQNQVNITDQ